MFPCQIHIYIFAQEGNIWHSKHFFIGQQYALGLEPAALLKLMRHLLFKDITAGFNSCGEKKGIL